MSPKTLRAELKMTRPFKSVEEEAILSIARTAAVIEHSAADGQQTDPQTFSPASQQSPLSVHRPVAQQASPHQTSAMLSQQ